MLNWRYTSLVPAKPRSVRANFSTLAKGVIFGLTILTNSLAAADFKYLPEIANYAAFEVMGKNASHNIEDFHPQTGIQVLERDSDGKAIRVKVRVLADNSNEDIRIYGDFNGWSEKTAVSLRAEKNGLYFSGEVSGLTHKGQYRFLVNGESLIDPSADMYSTAESNQLFGIQRTNLNSIFWDIEGEGRPNQLKLPPDLRGRPVVLGEQELYELVKKWPDPSRPGQMGPVAKNQTYRFVRDSGIIPHLKSLGYNAFEFLPFNQSMDGDLWSYRYQVFGLFAPNSLYGTPAEFGEMVSRFNQEGLLVVMDTVIGHYPFQGNKGVRDIQYVGLHKWKKGNGQNLYGSEMSPWNTFRYDYQNPYVRQFLIDSVLEMMKHYAIGGVRFDNYDGIRFSNGGTPFLKELAQTILDYRPEALLIAEMFFGERQVVRGLSKDGYGITARTHKDFFDFIKDNARQGTYDINMNTLRTAVRGPWEWGEAPRLSYITNHDEAANGRGGATGSYFASMMDGGGNYYVMNKTKAYGSLAMLSGSFYMDMPQLRLGQKGSFNDNPATDWNLQNHNDEGKLNYYFKVLSNYFINESAFSFQNQHSNIENHTDYNSKVVSLERIDQTTGRKVYAVINLSHQGYDNYSFGINAEGTLRLVFNGDAEDMGGRGDVTRTLPNWTIEASSEGSHGKAHSLRIPYLPPYGVLIFQK